MSNRNPVPNTLTGSLPTLTVTRQTGADDPTKLANSVQAANAQSDIPVIDLEGRSISTPGLTFNNYTKLQNGKLIRQTGVSTPILSLPSQSSLQTAEKSIIRDVIIDGSNKSAGSVGVAIGNHAAVVTQNVRVFNEETGFQLRGAQFCDFYSAKAYNNKVGFDIANTAQSGGANSLYFSSPQAVNNEVGILLQNVQPASYPMHSIEIISPQLLSNTLCGLACIDLSNITVRGFANESNGSGAASSGVYSGQTIKKSSVYLLRSTMTVEGGFVAEASVDPVFLLENNSHLCLNNISGYGNTIGTVVNADATSTVTLQGDYGCIGVVHGATRININVTSARGMISGTPQVRTNLALPNLIGLPQALGFSDTNGATSNSSGIDANQGTYASVQFGSFAGGADSNRVRFQMNLNGSTLIAFNVWASVDTVLSIGIYPNVNRMNVTLRGGEWTRVFWWYATSTVGSIPIVMYAADAAGAEVRFAKWHVVTGTDSRALRQQWNAVLSGDYNPQSESGLAPLVSSGRWTPTAPAGTTNAPISTLNSTIAGSFVLARHSTLTGLALEVTTSVASGVFRIGIWAEYNNLPWFLILDAGTIDASTTGTKSVTISQELPPGRYFLSATPQVAAGAYRTAVGIGMISHSTTNNMTQYIQSAYMASTSMAGALPSTFGAINSVMSDAPRFLVQVA